mgnify:CR=1 FL=1
MSHNEDGDREMRSKSEDNERFAGNKKTPGKLHSKEANTRMGGGDPGRAGSGRGDDDVTLAGMFPGGDLADVSKDGPDRPEGANHDVDDLADQLLQLDDRDTAQQYARMILRIGDIAASVDSIEAELGDDHARLNDRISPGN